MQLPEPLLNALVSAKGFHKESFEAVHSSNEQVTSIRINPFRDYRPSTNHLFSQLTKIPWTDLGYYLDSRPSFTFDPLFHAGCYYVQEASSMFLEQALKQTVDLTKPLKILDLCAAPGGKSTHIQSLINKDSLLVSNEVIRSRATILKDNIIKWGCENVVVTNNDPRDFSRLENYFDVIIVDAPCSGSGLFRRDRAAIQEWSENNVQLCSQRQQRILSDIMPALKEGGVLIYSTCSYSTAENEMICDWIAEQLAVGSLQLAIDKNWGIVETESEKHKMHGYRFYPDKVKGEGFFIAAFRKEKVKESGVGSRESGKRKSTTARFPRGEIEILKPWLKDTADLFYFKQNNETIAMPVYFEKDLTLIQEALYIKKAGVKLGSIIRDELIPDHELALSVIINNTVKCIEADKETALQYLRREEIKLVSAEKGWVLLTYQQLPLGWVKILPNRVNNYYPTAWRILNK